VREEGRRGKEEREKKRRIGEEIPLTVPISSCRLWQNHLNYMADMCLSGSPDF
jgi:hypothetical protein